MSFDPNMTYWQSLRIVARGLIQSPFREGDLRYLRAQVAEIGECMLVIGSTVGGWFVRLAATILMPISAPILTCLVQVERRKTAKQHEEARRRADEHWNKLTRLAQKDGGKE